MTLSQFCRIKWEHARDLKKKGRFQEAENELKEALDEAPDNFLLKSSLAELYLRQDRTTEARILADSILSSDAQHPQAQYILGEIYFKQEKFEEALQCFRRASMNDSRQYIQLRIARALREMRRSKEALEILDSSLLNDKENVHFLREKALILNRLKRWDEALELYEKIRELDPEDSFARRQVFRLKGMNRPDEVVIRELKKVVDLPATRDDAHLHGLLGQKLRESGKLKEAAAEYRAAQRLAPDDMFFLKQEGFCHYKLGDYQEAARILGQAFRKDPNDYIVRSTLQKTFEYRQNMGGFISLLEEIINDQPHNMKLVGILKKLKKQ
ncbi:MAG: tetratricopeptide repeat protein [Deltaproteobacteria bacterium]|nr:tetratricopeptide repeat protein [Deltaproteobacteria bacterium]